MSYKPLWEDFRTAILFAANTVKTKHPDAWEEVKVPGQTSRRFIGLVAAECQKTVSAEIGCNLKRGGPDVSLDVLAMPNASGCRDATGTFAGLELVDIIKNAERSDATLDWGDATQKTIDAGVPGGWIKAPGVKPVPVTPPAPVVPSFPYPDENTAGKAFQERLRQAYSDAGRTFPDPNDRDAFRHFMRYGYSARSMPEPDAANKHIAELRRDLGLRLVP